MKSEILYSLFYLAQTPDALLAPNADEAGRGYYSWGSSLFWQTIIGLTFLFTVVFFYRLIQNYRSNFR